MGTKVRIDNRLPGQSSTRDIGRESNGGGWPSSCYTDGSLSNGRFHYGYLAKTISSGSYRGYDKGVLKQTMLEHEAIFKDQVYELHRLYKVQRGLMDEVRRKDPPGGSLFHNSYSPKTSEASEFRPNKFRKRMLDLQLPADEYIDTDSLHISKHRELADLNEPVLAVETTKFLSFSILGKAASHSDASFRNLPANGLDSLCYALDSGKPVSVQPSLFQSSLHCNESFSKWDQNRSRGPNAGIGSSPVRNCSYDENRVAGEVNNRNNVVNPVRDINLNEDPLAVLPWPRGQNGIEAKILEDKEVECTKKKYVFDFDMNLPCDETSDSEVGKIEIDEVRVRNHFDLNRCIYEEVGTGIDLEALSNLENDGGTLKSENNADDGDAESAASAIVAMSSCVKSTEERSCLPPETEGDDPLAWFVSIACCTLNDGLDEFEYMNSRIKELTLDEYFPKPIVPDSSIVDNTSTTISTSRTRKGQGRRGRGRQRRDFQRDILPGLTTLSRHEVTEDLQTFGGLMRAMGHSSWHSGSNRRHAARGSRGKRRYVETSVVQEVQKKNVEVSVVDRTLTGWGKTTRRPRRQRCPAAKILPLPCG